MAVIVTQRQAHRVGVMAKFFLCDTLVCACAVKISVVRQIAAYFSLTYEHIVILLSP
jgi:hypothetical protein